MSSNVNQELVRYRNLVLAIFYSLFLVLFLNALVMTIGVSVTTFIIWLLQVFPLTLFISGLHRFKVRTFQWLSFVVLMYFVHGVLTGFHAGQSCWSAYWRLSVCCLLFGSLIIVFVRKSSATHQLHKLSDKGNGYRPFLFQR